MVTRVQIVNGILPVLPNEESLQALKTSMGTHRPAVSELPRILIQT
jgi:hypothetical protein